VLSTAAYPAEKETEGDPTDAIVWDELVARTREEGLNLTLLTSRQFTPTQGASGSVVSKGWISVSPPGPAAAETNPRTGDFVQQRPRGGRDDPLGFEVDGLVKHVTRHGHGPFSRSPSGRTRPTTPARVTVGSSTSITKMDDTDQPRRTVQQVSGCRRVRRQAEAR
jgi:hypothetical protein